MAVIETAYLVVFAASVLFTALTIYRQTKFSALYSTIAMVFWFALAGINVAFSATELAILPLSYLWFVLGLVAEILGFVITVKSMQADTEAREMQL